MSEVIEQQKQEPVKETKPEPIKRVVILNPQRMKLAEYERQEWVCNAEEGTTIHDILDPQYWAHMAPQMRPYDRIEVRIDTGEWFAELIVLSCERNWARVHLLRCEELASPTEDMLPTSKFKVEWKGPQRKWEVIRLADSEAIQSGLADRQAANMWLRNYEAVTLQ